VGGASTLEVHSGTVGEILSALAAEHPGFGQRVLDPSGSVRRFVNVFVDDLDVRHAEGLATPVAEGQTISILPAVAGG
jgi:molybdopterin synthase sulfur carrier subunit